VGVRGAVGGRGAVVGGRGRRRAPAPRGAAHQDGSAHNEGTGAGRAEEQAPTPWAGLPRLWGLGAGRTLCTRRTRIRL